MSFSANTSQQFSFFDATSNLTDRELKMLDKSFLLPAKNYKTLILGMNSRTPFI